ncbi:hypothetical protein [Variovorax sp. PBS-H4]|uniref:hypothetical protein n=1 Tax=Variovorax sp. PBS-H4 TaxID=434008 RepID=UPI0013A53F9F|nr:hypothetical protein [Variovorax sp. PBS-H4]
MHIALGHLQFLADLGQPERLAAARKKFENGEAFEQGVVHTQREGYASSANQSSRSAKWNKEVRRPGEEPLGLLRSLAGIELMSDSALPSRSATQRPKARGAGAADVLRGFVDEWETSEHSGRALYEIHKGP